MTTVRLTMAQALVRFLAAQGTVCDGREVPLFAGVWAIFGHGNVAGVGEALYRHRAALPTYRAHNEQAMAHAAIAFAKAHFRRRMMACTTSIGPGATNLITAAATAHVNRLPVLFLPGDVFVSRAPDPVLQQVEDFHDGGDLGQRLLQAGVALFRPHRRAVAAPDRAAARDRRADRSRAMRPGDARVAAGRAGRGVRLSRGVLRAARSCASARRCRNLSSSRSRLRAAARGEATGDRRRRRRALQRRRREALQPIRRGASRAGRRDAGGQERAAVGPPAAGRPDRASPADGREHARARRRSRARRRHAAVGFHDGLALAVSAGEDRRDQRQRVRRAEVARHRRARRCRARARGAVRARSSGWTSGAPWQEKAMREGRRMARRRCRRSSACARVEPPALPYDGEVIGAVQRTHPHSAAHDIVVCAAGTLPAELHKLWRAARPGGYHMEYGYSCMGYEIAGGIGVKMAHPDREVVVMVGDGSYLMLNSEIATSVMLGTKLVIVVLDNRGYGCIHRLQRAVGGEGFNNLFDDCVQGSPGMPAIDFAAHARSLGALAEHVDSLAELEAALARARAADRTCVVVIDTDPLRTTEAGGWWWEVGVPEVSESSSVRAARIEYEHGKRLQRQ